MTEAKKPPATKALVGVIDGDMVAENPEGVLKIAGVHLRSGMLPRHYNTIEKIVTASTWASELGLKPITAMRQIAVINGSPSLYGDLPLALVKKSPAFDWIREYFVDAKCEEICVQNKNLSAAVYGAVCVTKRKGEPHSHETFFTLDDKKLAGLSGNTWSKFTKDMLLYRARTRNLKSSFPECLNGANIAEYDNAVLPEVEGVVIDSVLHNGERSRMSEIREKFVESPKKEVASELLGKGSDDSGKTGLEIEGVGNGNGGRRKKKTRQKKVQKRSAKVGSEDPAKSVEEVPELWPTN